MLKVSDLHVTYGNVAALRGVSIEVQAGEIVAVIGPNGAGKSTLLLTIAGVVKPARGAVALEDSSILGIAPEKLVTRGLSLVPEGRHIFASMTVAENIRLGGTGRQDKPAIAQDRDRVLAMFPILQQRLQQKAGQLSGGEQQMLAIARAIMARPRLLLIDEPSLGLAPLIVNQVYEAVSALRDGGVTVLVVEQNVHRALAVADRTYVMNSGSVTMAGRSSELKTAEGFQEAYFGFRAAKGVVA
ncbi:ABC transporter ATP-binding protein [Hypericibacter terrae]|uniref:ABC transporter ATP-binding protein n=1 Tax=Hypericibacter terrae TaxID=2602015 RepID=A0A5J6MLA6_9PROT|nr:ABC transporter ATP-binding protein [Hypericibacter terrae]QEX18164.1 ABC transporter ATP-binding protein [Hypericibacter terrae]